MIINYGVNIKITCYGNFNFILNWLNKYYGLCIITCYSILFIFATTE